MDTRKKVSRLLGLEFDEISLVDRPANQHGLVTITKRDEGPMYTDADGNPVDFSTLQYGAVVYDEAGNEFEWKSPEEAAELEAEGVELHVPDDLSGEVYDDENADEDERELATVGKASGQGLAAVPRAFEAGKKKATKLLRDAEGGYRHGRSGVPVDNYQGNRRTRTVAAHVGRNEGAYAAGVGAGAVGYGTGRVKKSLGQEVLESLSKAYTDGDRDEVISKAMEHVQAADERAEQAIEIAKALEERQEHAAYVEFGKSYQLPVDEDELGTILQTIAKSGLTAGQLDLVDRVFALAGEAIPYDELGADGLAPSAVEELVYAQANEVVGKSDMTAEQATSALFSQNPELYDQYLLEH